MNGSLQDLRATFTRWRIWWLMARQDILMRYRRSLIGPFWISLSMMALILGLAVLYGQIFRQPFKEYLYFLGCGFLVWGFIFTVTQESTQVVIEAEPHLRGVPLPIPILVARMLARNVIIFLHNLLVIGGIIVLFGIPVAATVWLAIPGMAVLVAIGFCAGLFLGPLCARFRDVSQLLGNVMQIVFFMTPIVWRPDQGGVRAIFFEINPFYHLIELVRAPLMDRYPSVLNWTVSLSVLAVMALLAYGALGLARRRVYYWL
ncbi:MAG: ABC transporter permease [Hyphomonadaceae bacterium]